MSAVTHSVFNKIFDVHTEVHDLPIGTDCQLLNARHNAEFLLSSYILLQINIATYCHVNVTCKQFSSVTALHTSMPYPKFTKIGSVGALEVINSVTI